MNFHEYQAAALETQQIPAASGTDKIVPLLGLSSEVGELLNTYKKRLRDGESHLRFEEHIREELGDILWYLSDVASKFGLDLDDIAHHNIEKVKARWGYLGKDQSRLTMPAHNFDGSFPEDERLPRQFFAQFQQHVSDGRWGVKVYVQNRQMGQSLTDNAHESDGYRFHDVFHLACAAFLGWSPVTRRNLNCKRRSDSKIDEVEDGGRAIVIEEGISALVFAYAIDHAHFKNIESIDYDLLKAIKVLSRPFEVAICTTGEWEHTILEGYTIWRQVEESRGGVVAVDLDERTMSFSKTE